MKIAVLRAPLLASLLLVAQPEAWADLGRLFYTPEERARLDRAPGAGEPAAQAPRTVNGIVRRSDGQGTVWIDGRSEARRLPNATSVTVPDETGGVRRVRVGEPASPDTDSGAPRIRIERTR